MRGRVVVGIMNRTMQTLVATLSVFAGSLLSDVWFGDGIETDDIQQAIMVALIAGIFQLWFSRKKPQ